VRTQQLFTHNRASILIIAVPLLVYIRYVVYVNDQNPDLGPLAVFWSASIGFLAFCAICVGMIRTASISDVTGVGYGAGLPGQALRILALSAVYGCVSWFVPVLVSDVLRGIVHDWGGGGYQWTRVMGAAAAGTVAGVFLAGIGVFVRD
jgi:hypothetical protein